MDIGAGIVGLVAGALVGPLADLVATNAPIGQPLLRRVPFSRWVVLVTATTALLGGACGLVFGFEPEALIGALLCWILVALTRTDLEHRLLPDRIVLPGTVLMLVGRSVDEPTLEWLIASLAAAVLMFVVVLIYPRGMGMGDVKLLLLLGAGLGAPVAVAVFVGFFLAFLPAVVLFARHGRGARKLAIPLGPFLAAGAVFALFWGDAVLDWYTSVGT